MTVYHIVGFKAADAASLAGLTKDMLALKDNCVRDGKPYILSVKGGKQTSPEAIAAEIDVVFVMEMGSQEDLNFYLDECPAHADFKKTVRAVHKSKGAITIDFLDGSWPQ